jgi:methylmalonyl-CoA mutase cobalamin-binding domain/chain
MTHKERILKVIRGEMADRIPYVPRLDLWHNANALAQTLPERHRGKSPDSICRDEGWALHKAVPDFANQPEPDAMLHRALGIFSLREQVLRVVFSPKVEIRVIREAERTTVEYHTPRGVVRTASVYSEEMKKAGISIPWIAEHAIKKQEDYAIVACLFENMDLTPHYEEFRQWQQEIGEEGMPTAYFTGCASPIHHIQKQFLDATAFYFHYSDYQKEMRNLAESMATLYDKALQLTASSPAEMVHWGGNYDDMVTYAPYFEKELLPWIRKASECLGACGKYVSCHCDGENEGLMDLIRDSGMHVAEAVCPAPMTKVTIEEYYRRWADRLTIFGGIPSTLLLRESTTDAEFEGYLDHLFKAVAPGTRMILGIADTTPPQGVFDRLVRIGERVEKEGRLPLEGGAFRPLTSATVAGVEKRAAVALVPDPPRDEQFRQVQDDVLGGDQVAVRGHILGLLERGAKADEILQRGLLAAMEVIGERFRSGDAFIPEVLLSARVMNEAVSVLEPYLTSGQAGAKGRVMIGTVKGDMHDIGKNLVITMLRGVGYEVKDLGVDVPVATFVEMVKEFQPDILGLSSLLTTTMPQMKQVIEALSGAGLRDGVKVIVGGAPVNEKYACDIGADGYAHDAGGGVKLVESLLPRV